MCNFKLETLSLFYISHEHFAIKIKCFSITDKIIKWEITTDTN